VRPSVLITAGPTRERIDPVRFISNYSTGIFGYEIAKQAAGRGWRTCLVSGPTGLKPPSGVKFIEVESAEDMRRAVKKESKQAGFIIMAAAVSDWKAKRPAQRKIKRSKNATTLKLVENPDIVKELGRKKKAILAGFALETEGLEKNAFKKLKEKNLDLIIANRLKKGSRLSIFGDNKLDVLIIDRFGNKSSFYHKDKRALAKIILDKVLGLNIIQSAERKI